MPRSRSRSRSRDCQRGKRNESSTRLDAPRSQRRRRVSSESAESAHSPRRHKAQRKRRSSSSSSADERQLKKASTSRHHKKRRRQSSSSSSGNSDALDEKLRLKRLKEADDQRKLKEKMKALETPEQKRARRMQKKMLKEQKVKHELGWDEEVMGYSNAENPFGDTKLTETFVWRKKLEKDGLGDASLDLVQKNTREKLLASKEELEKVKRLRLERERLKAEREKEAEMMQRDKELSQYKEWSQMEDEFHLQQARMRSRLRIKERRAKPIDLLAHYICDEEEDDLEIEMNEPFAYLKGLSIRDLEDLLEDIKVYRKLEKGKNEDYWRDMAFIAEDELQKLQRKIDESVAGRRQGINASVRKDIVEVLKGKSLPQLALLETEIMKKIKGGQAGIDIGYWETLLEQLKAHMAKARLRDKHQETLRRKLQKLKEEQIGTAASLDLPSTSVKEELPVHAHVEDQQPSTSVAGVGTPPHSPVADVAEEPEQESGDQPMPPEEGLSWEDASEEERRERMKTAYDEASYSPQYVVEESLPPASEIVDSVEDKRRIAFARKQFKESGIATAQQDASLGMSAMADGAQFSVEHPLEKKSYLWSDKYRPRKPRYFNRVHTGFEWNKYNQTHYDLDNPPPKIVQGYKFNIFYPDLLDPTKAPEFTLVQCDDSTDFAILKFHAGPPYEDIAFKIVNREWEVSHRRGFRSQFQNGVFQLWFHFKKYRYRR